MLNSGFLLATRDRLIRLDAESIAHYPFWNLISLHKYSVLAKQGKSVAIFFNTKRVTFTVAFSLSFIPIRFEERNKNEMVEEEWDFSFRFRFFCLSFSSCWRRDSWKSTVPRYSRIRLGRSHFSHKGPHRTGIFNFKIANTIKRSSTSIGFSCTPTETYTQQQSHRWYLFPHWFSRMYFLLRWNRCRRTPFNAMLTCPDRGTCFQRWIMILFWVRHRLKLISMGIQGAQNIFLLASYSSTVHFGNDSAISLFNHRTLISSRSRFKQRVQYFFTI